MNFRTKLYLVFSALFISLIVLIATVSLVIEENDLRRFSDRQKEIIIETITVFWGKSMEAGFENIASVLDHYIGSVDNLAQAVYFIRIVGIPGVVFYEYPQSAPLEITDQTFAELDKVSNLPQTSITNIDGNLIRILDYPLVLNEEFLGVVSVGFYDQYRMDSIWLIRLRYIIITLLACLLVFGVSFYISNVFIKPIQRLMLNFHVGFHEDNEKEPKPKKMDEIEALSLSFQGLVRRLERSFDQIESQRAEIERFNSNLQSKIEERTREVADINLALKVANEKMMNDLEMARRVQLGILPKGEYFQGRTEFRIGTKYLPMDRVGGDLIDIIRVGKNGYGFLIADVSGHGVSAAFITAMAKVLFINKSGWNIHPAQVFNEANTEIFQLIGDLGYYITAYYGIINLENGVFSYACGGHHPALLYHNDTKTVENLKTSGMVIGIMRTVPYERGEVQLHPGDKILLFTDGIVETRNAEGELYGHERLEAFFAERCGENPEDFVDDIITDIDRFSGNLPQDDDRALLFIHYVSNVNNATPMEHALHFQRGVMPKNSD